MSKCEMCQIWRKLVWQMCTHGTLKGFLRQFPQIFSCSSSASRQCTEQTNQYFSPNTQIHTYTNTQIYKYTDIQIYKYRNIQNANIQIEIQIFSVTQLLPMH